ncbi:CatB-related O-acetyltransferase [Aureibacter tunicatorum]|uniref:Virginiamycin A acetyltransferase n=1 Tax=Aureibacter tunicatorum TaxID=866807 RepID=A0AAE4BRA1_9BACT|nr:CatB-related O-acetyltransferase [Aureibacter tunicatorum]MDR6239994.1 virginiamycin A acetyltransferase [Aureibacter tunicatorum]BDD04466.1 acetyltransferase [Aureibacter tunicatorum]
MSRINSDNLYPIEGLATTIFLKPLVEESEITNVFVGEYTYYSDFKEPKNFLRDNVLYNYGISNTALRIGKFCALANGAKFIMADANHATEGITTFPFPIFGGDWADTIPLSEYPLKRYSDIIIGNDVWLGESATIMPGVKVGNGSIVGSKAVVSKDVPPYSIVVGNPARVVRTRFSNEEIAMLEKLSWWDWPIEHIEKNMTILVKRDIKTLWDYAMNNHLIKKSL